MNETMDAVVLRDVVKTYRRGKEKIEVLHHLDLSVKRGEFLALIGPSGSGKTTVLNLIGGVYPPHHCEVNVSRQGITRAFRGPLPIGRTLDVRPLCSHFQAHV